VFTLNAGTARSLLTLHFLLFTSLRYLLHFRLWNRKVFTGFKDCSGSFSSKNPIPARSLQAASKVLAEFEICRVGKSEALPATVDRMKPLPSVRIPDVLAIVYDAAYRSVAQKFMDYSDSGQSISCLKRSKRSKLRRFIFFSWLLPS
jgi:hypothetical protein